MSSRAPLMYPICSPLFPHNESIKICSEAFYIELDAQLLITKDVFKESKKSARSSANFSFNNTTFKETGGVAMELTPGTALAKIFIR